MKKIILSFVLIFAAYTYVGNILATSNVIPKDALRMRVIANSDSAYDQKIKLKVKEKVQSDLSVILKDTKTSEEAKKEVEKNIKIIEDDVRNVLLHENYPLGYFVHFGKNYFPEKKYKGITYEEGYYDSLVVTLGKGKGENFWCVMFPPLCTMETESLDDIEYKSFVTEVLKKYI